MVKKSFEKRIIEKNQEWHIKHQDHDLYVVILKTPEEFSVTKLLCNTCRERWILFLRKNK